MVQTAATLPLSSSYSSVPGASLSTVLWCAVLLAHLAAAGVELQAAEPALSPQLAESCQHAKVYAQEGWCDPAAANAAFLADAQAAGATVMYNQQVILFRSRNCYTSRGGWHTQQQPPHVHATSMKRCDSITRTEPLQTQPSCRQPNQESVRQRLYNDLGRQLAFWATSL